MRLLGLVSLVQLALTAVHQLIPSRTPELFTTPKTVPISSLVQTSSSQWYFRVWMYVTAADADMKQLAITKQDNSVLYCKWDGTTFTTEINSLLSDTYDTAFALNKWIFQEIGVKSGTSYGRLLARGGGMRRVAETYSSHTINPEDTITSPISANPFSVRTK